MNKRFPFYPIAGYSALMSPRILAGSSALLIALAAPAAAQALPTIQPLKPCYVTADTAQGLFVDDTDQVVGYAYSWSYRPRPAYNLTRETSIYLDLSVRGKGVGRLLYPALLQTMAVSGVHTAVALVSLPNPASERLLAEAAAAEPASASSSAPAPAVASRPPAPRASAVRRVMRGGPSPSRSNAVMQCSSLVT